MASKSLLRYSLVLLLFVQLSHSATVVLPKPKNHIEEQSPSNTYIVQTNQLSKPPRFATLDRWYASMVATHSPRSTNDSGRVIHTYDTVMHGFAVRLTDDEAQRMSSARGVSGLYKERTYYIHTTRSPEFIGLDPERGAWPESNFGDGVIIGFIDTGIWPERASFDDAGLGPVRPSWRGKCDAADGFNASLCNNKLVGARAFTQEIDGAFTPRDKFGHGTHVSSTAAGSQVAGANLLGFSRGTAWGVAPRARVAMYKACTALMCADSDIVAAVDAAVKDGVDIISMSLGGSGNPPFYNDSIAVATFGAEREGVFVVLSGGNDGPNASTVTNVAPWMTTVGAGTMDRMFPARLRLGNGVVLTGQSLYANKAKGTGFIRLVRSSCNREDLTPDHVMGKLVVCTGLPISETYVQSVGGAGIIGFDSTERLPDGVFATEFALPGLTLSHAGGEDLRRYMASTPYPAASLRFDCDTVTGKNRAPMVVGFSSRGPNTAVPEILKPDVIAPGVNILAAWSGKSDYSIISGTSMACPHVAGVAALLKRKHREWTPSMIRSAIMTTTATVDNKHQPILDNGVDDRRSGVTIATPLAAGAGLVRPVQAMDPGLVYEAGTQDYVDFLCTLNYTVEQMRQFVPDLTECTRTLPGGRAASLNYPSLVVIFDCRSNVRTLTRTVTTVSAAKHEKYSVTVVAPDGVQVTVTPATLQFDKHVEKKSYTVEFRSEARPTGWDFGYLVWESRLHKVTSPVAFKWEENNTQ